MSGPKTHELTVNEAAVALRIPLRQVHRMIDARVLGAAIETRAGTRRIGGPGLLALKLAYVTADLLKPAARRTVVEQVLRRQTRVELGERILTFQIATIETDLAAGLAELAAAKEAVATDPDILGGTPCFAGTRVPVHDVADMLANGDTPAALVEAYPALDERRIRLASTYAAAYPRRGRPKPARAGGQPKSVKRLRLEDVSRAR